MKISKLNIIVTVFFPSLLFAATIVVDPGHGGEELGAFAKNPFADPQNKPIIYEKDLTLKVAKALKVLLAPNHKIYLTRSDDRDVSLEQRASLADKVKADLFLSLHFNSSLGKKHHGIEIFYLSNSENKAVHKLEKAENTQFQADPVVTQILIDLVIRQTVSNSRLLAETLNQVIEKRLVPRFSMKNRGVKPGLFHVLALSKRPGALIEGGFVSNKEDLKKILNPAYLQELARTLAQGIELYFSKPKD